MMVTLPMAGDAPDGPRSGPEDSHLPPPKAALPPTRLPIFAKLVDTRAGDDADVYHGPPRVFVYSLAPAPFRQRCAAATARRMSVVEATSEIAIPARSVHDS